VLDEIAYWRDESSATPDVEIYRAIKPSLDSTNGMAVAISSPYRRTGLPAAKHRDHYGKDSPDCLVIQSPSFSLNPTLDQKTIAEAYAADPVSASAEYGAEFRTDLQSLLADDVIDRAVDYGRPLEMARQQGVRYRAFVDASAGRHDEFCICIGHVIEDEEGKAFVADVVRGRAPPFDPRSVAAEYAKCEPLEFAGAGHVFSPHRPMIA
jgi:hypothetical protein